MKNFYMLLLVFFTMAGFTMAQTIENFETLKLNVMLGEPANDLSKMTVVLNPDSSAVDSSKYVVEFVRDKDGVVHTGFYATLDSAVDLTVNKYVHVKVWKERISKVTFKFEGTTSLEVESMSPQTKTKEWEELVFHFPTLTGSYSKIVFSPDRVALGTLTEDDTIYFDDFYVNNDPAVGSDPVKVLENFEFIDLNVMVKDAQDLSSMEVVKNPDPSAMNPSDYVVKFVRDKDGHPWDGFYSKLPMEIDVTQNKYVHVKVWKPRISVLKFKIEGGTAGNLEIPSMSPQTKTGEWEDIVFNFTEKTGKYPIITFMPDFEDPVTLTENDTIYFDDIVLNNDPTPMVAVQQVISVDMTNSGITAGAKVWIAGALGGVHGTWAVPGTVPENEMKDEDGDKIYTITLNLADGSYPFKFAWGNAWEHGDPIGERTFTFTRDTKVNYVWNVAEYTPVNGLINALIKLFPNPVTTKLTIQTPDMKGFVITDLVGRIMRNIKLQALNSTQIDLDDFKSGMYIIKVETSNGTYTSKFLKK
ncbi:MAG: T9SS type A sorting domain-containing protein [Verrucomicrobia bacterium]|nr:T9SS type A sorting domain-containing protein [Prolixibacteraceae bacterium]